MGDINPTIEESWKSVLFSEFNKPYFLALKAFLQEEKKNQGCFLPGHLYSTPLTIHLSGK